jgi:hypothetical protein
MPVSIRDRQELDAWLRDQMGPDRARTLMALLPEPPGQRWWQVTDPGQSFWVQHGTGFFIGQLVGIWLTIAVTLLARAVNG